MCELLGGTGVTLKANQTPGVPPAEIAGRYQAEQTDEVVRNGEVGTKRQATPR
jgi:hypothetical protein